MLRGKSSRLTVFFIVALLGLSFALRLGKAPDAKVAVSLSPEVLFSIGSFPVTNTLFWGILLSLALMVMAVRLHASLKEVPGTFQNIAEFIVEKLLHLIRTIMGDDRKAARVFPLVATMFLFILFANLFAFLPGSSAWTVREEPLFRAVMSDYGLVLIMTLTTVITAQVVAIIVNGPFGYLKKFINFSSPLNFVLGLMEIIGELAKILSLSFRLFGNIFAGEVLGAVMLFLMPYFLPLPFMFLGLLSAVIQAFVFSLLTTIFIALASEMPAPDPDDELWQLAVEEGKSK